MNFSFRLPLVLLACTLVLPTRSSAQSTPRTVFNDDAQMLMETPAQGATKFVQQWLDREVAAVKFSTFVFLAATPDVCTYDTQVGETYGDRFGSDFRNSWTPGIRALRREGTDALKVVTNHMHSRGKEVLAAIRMSDTHHTKISRESPLCSLFAVQHPHFVIQQPDQRTNETALDYSYSEVRAHRLAIMKEIVEEYDVDGLELNFVRWAKHFPRDKGREKARILTRYVGTIHKMMATAAGKRSRKPLTLGVRIPESIEACWRAGIDIETWVKRGWIDYVVLSTWNNTDPNLPVAEFTRFTKPAGVDTIVVMGNMMGCIYDGPPRILDRPIAMSAKHKSESYLAMLLTAAEARGAAANYYAAGANSISFWNVGIHFGGEATATPEQRKRIADWTQAVITPERVYQGPRTYRYLPMGKGISSRKPPVRNYPWYDEGFSPLGHKNSPVLTFSDNQLGQRQVFPFQMADGRDGQRLTGKLTFWVYHLNRQDQLTVDINGKLVAAEDIRRQPVGHRRGGLPGERLEISLADCPPFRGQNQLGLTLKKLVGQHQAPPYTEELEITVSHSP